jgi:hypothetical protein
MEFEREKGKSNHFLEFWKRMIWKRSSKVLNGQASQLPMS